MHQKLGLDKKGIYFQKLALEMNIDLFGKDSVESCNAHESLTRSYFALGDYREALKMEQVVYKFHKNHSGPDGEKTKAANLVLRTLTAKAVEKAKMEKVKVVGGKKKK